jgi:hypothetical protein
VKRASPPPSGNRGSARSHGFRLSQRRNDAELLHHAKNVPIAIGIHDFPAGDIVDGDSLNRYFLVCGRNSHVLAFVGAAKGPASNHFILFGDEILDGPVQIRVARKEEQNIALIRFRPNGGAENSGCLQSVAGGDYFLDDFEFSLVPDFFIEALNDGFVGG